MKDVATRETRYRVVIAICALLVLADGGLALVGWMSGALYLAGLAPGWIPMAPSTASLFILYGIAVLLGDFLPQSRPARLAATLIISLACATALLLFFLSSMGIHPDFEHPGARITGMVGAVPMGHISPVTALCFVIAGLSFLTASPFFPVTRRRTLAACWLTVLQIALSAIFLLAYLYGMPFLYGNTFVPPAATTTIAFILLGTALFALFAQKAQTSYTLNGTEKRATRLLVFVFVILTVGILTAGYLYYRQFEQKHRLEAEHRLSAIADLKVTELANWRKERLGDAALIQDNPAFAKLMDRYLANDGDVVAEKDLRTWLARLRSYYGYEQVLLVDDRFSERISIPQEPGHLDLDDIRSVAETIRGKKTKFLDFHRDSGNGHILLSIVVPVTGNSGGGAARGVVILAIDPGHYLYPFIQSLPVPSASSETLLVRREGDEVVYLNRLRFVNNPPLSFRFPLSRKALPAAMAVLGKEGVVEGLDYRGVPVVAALRRVPDSPWFLVAKTDTADIYAPVRERLWFVIALVAALLVGSAAGVGLIWRQQSAAFYKHKLRVEQEKLESEEQYRRLFENMLEGFAYCKMEFENGTPLDFIYLHVNQAFETLTGLRDVAGKKVSEVIPGIREADPGLFEIYGRVALSGNPERIEIFVEALKMWFNISVYSPGKEFFVAVFDVITERKEAEEALRESEERYRSLVECSPMAIFINRNNRIEYANPSALKLFGAGGSQDIIGKSPYEIVHPGFHTAMTERIGIVLNGGSVPLVETSIMGLDGIERQVEIVASLITSLHGPAIQVMMNDITHRKRAEAALLESEQRLRRAEEIARLGHWRIASDKEEVTWSDEIYRILGVTRETYHPSLEWYEDFVHPDDREVLIRYREALLRDGAGSFELRVILPDGRLRHIVGLGETERNEIGKAVATFGTFQDVTELKGKELELQEKNIELERLNYTISHDLKSPLVTVKTFLGYLAKDMAKGDSARIEQDMMYMRTAADRMGLLLEDLYNLSRLGRTSYPPVDVSFRTLAQEAIDLVAGRIKQRGALVKLDDAEVMLHGDRRRLLQIWQNLIDNAVKFMGDQAEPRIEVGMENKNVFFVKDNGQGIDPRYREKIFGLFEQLDPGVEGTGIGLALVKRIVELYEGKLWMESEGPGKGTAFFFTLPGALKSK